MARRGTAKVPMASTFDPKPGNFNDPKFWQGDVNKKITDVRYQGQKPDGPGGPEAR